MAAALPFRSACALAAAIRSRRIGARELLDLYLDRIARHDPAINAVVVLDRDRARKQARAADRALARGTLWGPLHGVPMTIKESFDVAGLPSTWGLEALRESRPAANAVVVDRLLAAGAIIFGKTNVPVMLADWQTFNPVYGTTNNPWALDRVPGGSSGGSAAALAAGFTALEYGSDIGASIRNPAHYCGVYGHKPTWGLVPLRGHALPGTMAKQDLSVAGPLARSASDLELALRVTLGPDDPESRAFRLRLRDPSKAGLRGMRVAVMLSHETAEVDDRVQERLQAVADACAALGARVSDRARPAFDMHEAHHVYIQLLRAETSSSLSDALFAQQLASARSLDGSEERYHGWLLRANTMFHRDWLGVNETRHRMRAAWAAFFREWDVLLCPTAATAAFQHNQRGERWERMIDVNGRPQPSTTQLFWAGIASAFYLPATVAPVGLTAEGLPVGVQIVGPQYGDRTTLLVAKVLEREYYRFVPPPPLD
jgi:amidase